MKREPTDIRNAILLRIEDLGWTRYRAWQAVKPHFNTPAPFYEFLKGQGNIGLDKLEAIFDALGLRVRGRRINRKPPSEHGEHGEHGV